MQNDIDAYALVERYRFLNTLSSDLELDLSWMSDKLECTIHHILELCSNIDLLQVLHAGSQSERCAHEA